MSSPIATPADKIEQNSLQIKRDGHQLWVKHGAGGQQTIEVPLRTGSFEHLSERELYEMAIFLKLRGMRSERTHRVYVSHLERFFFWMKFEGRRVIDEWALMDYLAALRNPSRELQANVLGLTFNPLTDGTADQYMAPVRSFCSHLHKKQLLAYNPASFVPRVAVANVSAFDRPKHFDDEQWALVLQALDVMPEETPGQRNRKARFRFVIRFGYAMGLRIGEQLTHSHADVKRLKGEWFLDVIGKGRRARRLSLTSFDDVGWVALKEYRQYLGLSAEPSGEHLPLLPAKVPVTCRGRGSQKVCIINETSIADSTWQEQFKGFIRDIVVPLQCAGDEFAVGEVFKADWSHLTPHSLRHTRITHLVECGAGLLDVQRFAGHEKLDTTAAYYQQ